MNRGRPRQFDTDTALHQAMLVFWRNGYRGTSLDHLTEALKINKPSLYSAFGDKETLFLRVIDFYRDTMIAPGARQLVECDDLREGLKEFFRSFSHIVAENDTPPGCMIACLLSEDCCESNAIREKLASVIDGADTFFTKVFQRHKKQLSPSLTPESAAWLLVSTLHGVSIRARAGAGRKEIKKVCSAFIEAAVPAA